MVYELAQNVFLLLDHYRTLHRTQEYMLGTLRVDRLLEYRSLVKTPYETNLPFFCSWHKEQYDEFPFDVQIILTFHLSLQAECLCNYEIGNLAI